ncbi:uncharacterized protein CDAR_513211 [Caerostris darwini]|uniref:Uncharacterized protein n=1 Tax=Caerostris darwini TaxID=1538125 RepID=A0AAV4W2U5_9ARAC|nr:uncharacterized protein CDAR_513211 [Caerostris darwini]
MLNKKKNCCFMFYLELTLFLCILILPLCRCSKDAILLNASPVTVKQYQLSSKSRYDVGYFNTDNRLKRKDLGLPKHSGIIVEKYFQIEPSDAVDGTKYSQPALNYHHFNSYPSMNVPFITPSKDMFPTISSHNPSHTSSKDQTHPLLKTPKYSYKPLRDLRFIKDMPDKNSQKAKFVLGAEYVITEDKLSIPQSDQPLSEDLANSESVDKNNFTDFETNLLSVSSDTVLSYDNPSSDENHSSYAVPVKKNSEHAIQDVPSHHSENLKPTDSNSDLFSSLHKHPKLTTQTSIVLNTHLHIELMNQTHLAENNVTTVVLPSMYEVENISSTMQSLDEKNIKLSSGIVAGIVIGVLVCVTILSSAVIYFLYRKYNGKCAGVVEGKFNSDNCGYLDDSLRSSIYLNNHIELPKESSEEMSSLDNDSFLNSLETMTIQNYWADNSKNTKV